MAPAILVSRTSAGRLFTAAFRGSPVKDFRGVWAKAVLLRAPKIPIKFISIATMLRAEPYSIDTEGRCQKCKQIVLRRKQKLVGLTPHDLRRTFARDARTADISQLD